MRICGVIAEYNPFHLGHAFHLAETRRILGADTAVVAAMSGNFVQRGSFALLDKYARAEMAVRGGADLVVELPLAAALTSAEGFARGAVATLSALGCDTLSFGSETADSALLAHAARLLDTLDGKTAPAPLRGLSYAAWRQKALEQADPAAAALLSTPNNTLAVEYCRALTGTSMQPLAIPRRGAAHGALAPAEGFASASYLRKLAYSGKLPACAPYMPPAAYRLLADCAKRGLAPALPQDTALLAILRDRLYHGLLQTFSADGFDQRLQKAVYQASSYEEAVSLAQTRCFPAARVRRAYLRAALSIPADAPVKPTYLRVLAIGPKGRSLLRRAPAHLPIVTKPVSEKRLDDALQPTLRRDAFADDLFALSLPDPAARAGGSHFRGTPRYIP